MENFSSRNFEFLPTVVWAHDIAVITKWMSTTDGAIDQKLFNDLE